jgi:hypothetical protein
MELTSPGKTGGTPSQSLHELRPSTSDCYRRIKLQIAEIGQLVYPCYWAASK